MEHQEQRPNDHAALYARIIVGWHARIGTDEWLRRFGHERERDEGFARYRHTVARFHDSDLSDPAVQLAIANEQIAGSMEWAYMTPVAEQVPGLDPASHHLGAIAGRLQELASRFRQDERPPEGERTVVRFSDAEDLLAKAREVYCRITGAEIQGAGGASFLISCSLERSEHHRDGGIVLLSPGILGVRAAPNGRDGDLLEQLGSEGLEILDVTGSSSS